MSKGLTFLLQIETHPKKHNTWFRSGGAGRGSRRVEQRPRAGSLHFWVLHQAAWCCYCHARCRLGPPHTASACPALSCPRCGHHRLRRAAVGRRPHSAPLPPPRFCPLRAWPPPAPLLLVCGAGRMRRTASAPSAPGRHLLRVYLSAGQSPRRSCLPCTWPRPRAPRRRSGPPRAAAPALAGPTASEALRSARPPRALLVEDGHHPLCALLQQRRRGNWC